MEYKNISDLSFFSSEQKEWFKNYTINSNGGVFNSKTENDVTNTLHGSRGYVVNLASHVDGERKQRQVVIHKAVADLFIRPMVDGEKLIFKDNNKLNTSSSNLEYVLTEKQKDVNKVIDSKNKKGITEEGRVCTICKKFKKWEEISGNKTSVCRSCASKRGKEYQKSVNFSSAPVSYDTYSERLVNDSPVDVDGLLGIVCTRCKNVFLITRSKVLNRIKSMKLYNVRPLICPQCKEKGEDNE